MIYTAGKNIRIRKNLSGGLDIIIGVKANQNSSISKLQGIANRILRKHVIVNHVAMIGFEGWDGKYYNYAYKVIEN